MPARGCILMFALTPGMLGACDRAQPRSEPAIPVAPAAETAVVATLDKDAADDPAIWAAESGTFAMLAERPVQGFIAGTDKQAGLYIYGLDGKELQFLPDGLLNNVDLRQVWSAGRSQVILGASDRRRMGIALYRFDPRSGDRHNAVQPAGFVRSNIAKPYGFCMGQWGGNLHAVLTGSTGTAAIYRLKEREGRIRGKEVARFEVGSQSEGCVVDEVGGALFISEEDVGLWRYEVADLGERTLVEGANAGKLTADIEGVTIINDDGRRYLLVSSQGDSAFGVWRLGPSPPEYVGRFSVSAKGAIDGVTATDGIDAHSGPVGFYSQGLVVVQDDVNDGHGQNFKLVDWRRVRAALRL